MIILWTASKYMHIRMCLFSQHPKECEVTAYTGLTAKEVIPTNSELRYRAIYLDKKYNHLNNEVYFSIVQEKGGRYENISLYVENNGVDNYVRLLYLIAYVDEYPRRSTKLMKKILTIDDIPIRTQKTMQGIVCIDRKTGEEKLFCSHLGDMAALVPNSTEGLIVFLPYDELHDRYKLTNRREEPSGGLWDN